MKEAAASMTEEAVEIIIGIMKMMIERQAIGDRDGSRGFDRYEPPRERGGYDRDDRRDDRRDGNRGYGFSRDDRDRGYGGDRDRGYGGDRDRGYGGDRYNRDDRRDRGGYDRYGGDR